MCSLEASFVNVMPRSRNISSRPTPSTPTPSTSSPKKGSSKKKLKFFNMVGSKNDYITNHMQEVNILIDLKVLNCNISNFTSCGSCSAKGSIKVFLMIEIKDKE